MFIQLFLIFVQEFNFSHISFLLEHLNLLTRFADFLYANP